MALKKDKNTMQVGDDLVALRLKRVEVERKRLSKIFEDCDNARRSMAVKPIDNIAFMVVILEDLQATIMANGVISEYCNGANQFGTKQSPEVMTYLSMIGNYNKLAKTLGDLLPPEKRETASDEIKAFM